MKSSIDLITLSPNAGISHKASHLMRLSTVRFTYGVRASLTIASCKGITDATRAACMLVEEADERMTKPWYRRLPADTHKFLSPSKKDE